MVWRNDKDRNRRRLPSIPLESKTVPTLTRLSLESMLPAVATSDESIERPTLLIMDGHNVDQVPFSRNSRQFWSPTIARSFPVHSTQRRELPSEEELESFGE
uniref:Uncharacterized protein n=1 Tax=Setaria digitata TaxID=48799 RepID=A0A915Q4V8_9BILA